MNHLLLRTAGLLLLAVLAWAGSVGLARQQVLRTDQAAQVVVADVQARVQEVLRRATVQAASALEQVRRARTPFEVPATVSDEVAVYIFNHDSLVWWSDHTLLSDFDNVSGEFRYRAVDTRRGKLLVALQTRGKGRWRALAYVPLEKRYGIRNRYLEPTPNQTLFGSSRPALVLDERALLPQVRAPDRAYLFSLAPDPGPAARPTAEEAAGPLTLLLAGICFYVLAWVGVSRHWSQRGQLGWGALALLGPLLVLRVALLALDLPFALADLALFDPKYYAASWWAPSLGDQLLNAALLATAAALVLRAFWQQRLVLAVWRSQLPQRTRLVGALLGLAALVVLLWWRYWLFGDTFANSQLDLDVSQSVRLTWLHGLLVGLLVLHSAVASVALYGLTRAGAQLLPGPLRPRAWRWLLAAELLLWVGAFAFSSQALAMGALAMLFAKAVLVVDGRQRARGLAYPATVFLVAAVLLWAVVGALAQQRHYSRQRQAAEHKLARALLLEHDVVGEFLLEEVAAQIATDPLVARLLTSTFPQPDLARQKIEKYYLRDYFTQYETGVRFFDGTGREFGVPRLDTTRGLDQYRRRVLRTAQPTEHPGLYLIGDAASALTARHYVKLLRLRDVAGAATPPATIVLELALKKLNPYSLVPELLVDQKYAPVLAPSLPFSFAVFGAAGLVAAEGEYDYSAWRPGTPVLRDPELYTAGLDLDDAHHWAVRFRGRGTDGPRSKAERVLVLTSPAYTAGNVLSNFSFLFLVHLLGGLLGGLLVTISRRQQVDGTRLKTSLGTKIQALLNAGALIPLIGVSIGVTGLSTRAYQRDLVSSYQRRGERVQTALLRDGHLTLASDSTRSREALTQLTENAAALTGTDVLLYNPRGELLVSSQPLLLETGALTKLLNPAALTALRERGQPRVLLPETAGSLSFKTLYLPLRPPTTALDEGGGGRGVAGFIGIPFFDSNQVLDAKLADLVTTVMNIFTIAFILATFITFLATRVLTSPLRLLAEKLKQTTLTGTNERLAYESADEIGLLVGEYNQMLTKLEASRQELAERTQEAAWREMARQVAHEIKNPLTPMKLSLQYLQRAIRDGRADVETLIGKVSDTLITQIDTLADIATSFSSFVTLPQARPERVDLLDLLRHCLDLHPTTAATAVDTTLTEATVWADKNLLVRTFNNLLLNALQAIPLDRPPQVRASLEALPDGLLRVGIHDNGAGIPEDVQGRVFLPSFTTKLTGSGIGLSVAKRAIEEAGGQLWFESVEGEGTVFYLTLPRLSAEEALSD